MIASKSVGPHVGEDGATQARADAGDRDHRLEEAQLVRCGEPVQGELVFADEEVREEPDVITGTARFGERRRAGADAIDDAADIHEQAVRGLGFDSTPESGDHDRGPSSTTSVGRRYTRWAFSLRIAGKSPRVRVLRPGPGGETGLAEHRVIAPEQHPLRPDDSSTTGKISNR